jgi:hypothetical protein
VRNHFEEADKAMRDIIEDHKIQKEEVRNELTNIENMVDGFFAEQKQRHQAILVNKELQNLD